jgi:hypothetical protein
MGLSFQDYIKIIPTLDYIVKELKFATYVHQRLGQVSTVDESDKDAFDRLVNDYLLKTYNRSPKL